MLNLGIVEQTNSDDKWTGVLKNDLYDLIEVKREEQLNQLDGIVIPMEKTEQLAQVIEWIIACRINPSAFIWVFSKVPLEAEKRIMMRVGATDVITTPETQTYLSMSVENTFMRLGNKGRKSHSKQGTSSCGIQLNELNQSIVVNNVETELTRTEYRIFSLLYNQMNSTVTYKTISDAIWPGKKLTIAPIANIICHIREKVGKSETYSITTVRSKGYMLRVKGA